MKKILTTDQAPELGNILSQEKKRVVLAGGCFDILHIGHLSFLQMAKNAGDVLCLLLESDETIAASKGPKRPINKQQDRASMLAALSIVDYIFLLPPGMSDEAYDTLVFAIKPAIIATTKLDPTLRHKQRQASALGAQIIESEQIENQSTTKIVTLLNEL